MTTHAKSELVKLLSNTYPMETEIDRAIITDIIDEIEKEIINFMFGNSTYRSVSAILSDYTLTPITRIKRMLNDNNFTISDFC